MIEPEERAKAEWSAEAKRRLEEIQTGAVKPVPLEKPKGGSSIPRIVRRTGGVARESDRGCGVRERPRPASPTTEPPGGARVRLTVERIDSGTGRDVLLLTAGVYAGLSAKDIEEIEAMSRRRPLRHSSR